jgi:peroxiredoxin
MKRFLTLALLLSSTLIIAQDAPDFTFTDTEGNTHSLYETLDEGKVVLLDFFFVDCPPCIDLVPEIESIIEDFEGTTLEVWAMSDRDSDAYISSSIFASTHGHHFVGGSDGGGDAAVSTFASAFTFMGFPTYAIVCSDKSITWDVWPVSAGADEIRQHLTEECGVVEATVSSVATISGLNAAQVAPNPVSDFATLKFNLSQNTNMTITVVNTLGQIVKTINAQDYPAGSNAVEINANELSNGIYFARMNSDEGVHTVDFIVSGK